MEPDIELALHGVSGYNIIRYFHRFYAIPQSEGEFVLEKVKAGGYSSSFSGNSVESVIRKIASWEPRKIRSVLGNMAPSQPELALEGFYGFNIIRLGDEYHAILQKDGEFEYAKVVSKKYSLSFSGRSLPDVQREILANTDHRHSSVNPISESSEAQHLSI